MMKRILAVLAAMTMLFASAALAEDYSAMTDEEVFDLYNEVLAEMIRRSEAAGEKIAMSDPDEDKAIVKALISFIDAWNRGNFDYLLEHCSVEWKSRQENPGEALSAILQDRKPLIMEVQGYSEEEFTDTSRSLNIMVLMLMRYSDAVLPDLTHLRIGMIKDGDHWNVDPESFYYYSAGHLWQGESVNAWIAEQEEKTADLVEPKSLAVEGIGFATDEIDCVTERIAAFMRAWADNQYDDMVSLCSGEWKSHQENVKQALFTILQNRKPIECIPEQMVKDPSGGRLEMTMTVTMEYYNKTEPVRIRMTVEMMQEDDGEWYLNPESLVSYKVVMEE